MVFGSYLNEKIIINEFIMDRLLIVTLEVLYNETKKKFGESGTAALTGLFVLRFLMPALALPDSIGMDNRAK